MGCDDPICSGRVIFVLTPVYLVLWVLKQQPSDSLLLLPLIIPFLSRK